MYHNFLTDEELEDLDSMFDEITKETKVAVPDIDWGDAYEANKTRETCIVCGKDTVDKPLLYSAIKFCPCVDELAKKD